MLPPLLALLPLSARVAPEPPPTELVYLAADARVCVDPLLEGPCFFLEPDADRGLEGPPLVLGYRGEQGGVLALEVVKPHWKAACGDGGWRGSPPGLRVYAARDQALATLKQAVTIREGQAAITLDPGAPLLPAGDGRWRLHPAVAPTIAPAASPSAFAFPPDAIGYRFPSDASAAWLDRRAERLSKLGFEDPTEGLGERAEVGLGTLDVSQPAGALLGGSLAAAGPCAVYRASLEPSAVLSSLGGAPAPSAEPSEQALPPGTALMWPGGEPAGRLAAEALVSGAPGYVRDGMRCWKLDAGYTVPPRGPQPFAWACLPAPPPAREPEPARVVLGALDIRGDLDPDALRRAIEADLPVLAGCFERAAAQAIAGEVQVQFAITPTGDTVRTEILSSTLRSPAIESCIDDHLLGLRFPQRANGPDLEVSYPLAFYPSRP